MNNKWAKAFTGDKARVDKLIGGNSFSQGRRVPKGTPIPFRGNLPVIGSATERYPLTAILARYNAVGGAATTLQAVYALVYTPSTRLRARINVFFQPSINTGVDPVFNTVPTWEVRSMGKHPLTGYEAPLQTIHTGNLPDEHTIDSAGELVRVKVVVDSAQFKEAYAPTAADTDLHMVVTWEPNTFIDLEDLKRYYEKCRIGTGQVLQIQALTIP